MSPDSTPLPQGMFVMVPSKPDQKKRKPASAPVPCSHAKSRSVVAHPEGLQFSSRFVAKTAASFQHGCVKSLWCGGVSRVTRGYSTVSSSSATTQP